jgi:hypothetical protein
MYQSLATFDLAQNLNIIDVLPTVPLQEGFVFGGPSNGFGAVASASGNGEATLSMPALQFQSRKGGALSTFSDWGQFKPNLNINPQNLEEQLANIDFDCVQMTQRVDAQGNVIAEAIKTGDPQAAYGKVFGWFNSLMQSINNWSEQGLEQQQATAALNQRILQDTANFEHNVRNLQNACDQQDQISSQMWSGLGISKPASVDSTYNICYAPNISNLQKLMDSRAAIEQQELTLRYQELTARKTNNADVQVAGTNFAEMVRIETENQKIMDSAQAVWAALYGKYKTLRTDPGEKDGNSIIGMLSLTSVDLEDMKIPPAGIQEFERLQRDVANQLAANQVKLNALNVKTDRIKLADQSISKHVQEQQDMLDAYKRMQDDYIGQDALNASMVNESYIENVAATEAQQRADDEKAAMKLSQNIQNANDKFFTFFNSTQRSAALNILPTLINDYFSIVKAFFGGQSLSDVMGNSGLGAAGNVNITEEWKLYQGLIDGGNS